MFVKSLKWCVTTLACLAFATLAIASPVAATNNYNYHNPPGNNGFIKVNEEDLPDSIPQNDPHVACKFKVEFYNYDKGNHYADVAFALQSPTSGPGYSLTVNSGNLHPFIGGDAAGGGNDLDAVETYTLGFTGTPQSNQGYHVKLTIHADGSQGNDTKHKVFWVEPCEKPKNPTVAVVAGPCVAKGAKTGTFTVKVTNPNAAAVNYAVSANGTTQNVTVAAGATESVTFTNAMAGHYAIKVAGANHTSIYTQVTIEECPPVVIPVNPHITLIASSCVNPGAMTGFVKVDVTNPNAAAVNYTIKIGALTQNLVVGAGQTASVTFSNLPAGTYSATVTGANQTTATASATIANCVVTPTTPQVSGASTTAPTPAAPKASVPAVLPATGADLSSSLWVVLVAAAITYLLTYRRQKRIAAQAE